MGSVESRAGPVSTQSIRESEEDFSPLLHVVFLELSLQCEQQWLQPFLASRDVCSKPSQGAKPLMLLQLQPLSA